MYVEIIASLMNICESSNSNLYNTMLCLYAIAPGRALNSGLIITILVSCTGEL